MVLQSGDKVEFDYRGVPHKGTVQYTSALVLNVRRPDNQCRSYRWDNISNLKTVVYVKKTVWSRLRNFLAFRS